MSTNCSEKNCKRPCRVLCHCCNENFCQEHLSDHLNGLTIEFHQRVDQLNEIRTLLNQTSSEINEKIFADLLTAWKNQALKSIDTFCSRKMNEFRCFHKEKTREKCEQLRHIHEQVRIINETEAVSRKIIEQLDVEIKVFRRSVEQLNNMQDDFELVPLMIDERCVQGLDTKTEHKFDLTQFIKQSTHEFDRSIDSSKSIASNGSCLLFHQGEFLCLMNDHFQVIQRIPWSTSDWIWDMCWSSTLSRFIFITSRQIHLLNPLDMSIELIRSEENRKLSSCTCSKTSFYLATLLPVATIIEHSLLSLSQRNPCSKIFQCLEKNALIHDIHYHRGTLALLIEDQTEMKRRLELRTIDTFSLIWNCRFDLIDPLNNAYRICPIDSDQWLVVDWRSSQIFYISNDGTIKQAYHYDPVPYRCCNFGKRFLAISTRINVQFYPLEPIPIDG